MESPMSEDEAIVKLQTLGLNLYESRAYLALLNAKELTAKGVGQLALIPQSRTYDVMDSLARKGFAMSTPASPPTYVAVEPTKILKTYYDSERKKIQERTVKIQEEAQEKLELIRDSYVSLTKELPSNPTESGPVRERVWVIQDRENIENTLVGFIKEANSEVIRVTKPPDPKRREPLDPFYIIGIENQRFLFDALERKIKMRWLGLASEIPTFLGLDVSEPPERRYLEKEQDITEKFLLVDNQSVLLNLHDPLSRAYGYVALAMQSRAVSSIFLDHFEKMWERGRPLSDLLPKMIDLVDEVCEVLKEVGFGKADVALYRSLAKEGASTKDVLLAEMSKRKFQQQESLASCDRLLRLGLIHKDNALRLFMVEHPSSVKEALLTGKVRPSAQPKLTTRQTPSGRNP